jgi:hypothetical protein
MFSTPSICASLSRKGSPGGDMIPGNDLKPIKYRCLRRTTVAEALSPVPVADCAGGFLDWASFAV